MESLETSFFCIPSFGRWVSGYSQRCLFDIGGFERGFRVWGREDEEISLKLWLFGYQCCVLPDIKVYHVFRSETQPFPLTWDDINYNLLRMAYSHFNEERIEKCKNWSNTRIHQKSNHWFYLATWWSNVASTFHEEYTMMTGIWINLGFHFNLGFLIYVRFIAI